MNLSNYMVLCFALIMLISFTQAKYYRIQPNYDFEERRAGDRRAIEDRVDLDGVARDRRSGHMGVTGPVHTFAKTNKDAHFKWGVKHHVGHHYAG